MDMKPGERAAEALLARYCLDPAFTDALRHDARLSALEEALARPPGETEELLRIGRKLQKQYGLETEDTTKYVRGLRLLGAAE